MGRIASALIVLGLLTQGALAQPTSVTMEWSIVGNAGNAADTRTGFGAVDYEYRIGTYEVTNDQYAAFLNAVATTDPYGLYNVSMDTSPRGGITRSGVDGSYTYAVKPNMGNKPVNHVGWYDALRMANWMTNGQGSGDTETGVYALDNTDGIDTLISINRDLTNPNQVFLPTEDEWYKAAFHQPFEQGGNTGDFWFYPTASNSALQATATSVGDVANPGPFKVNFQQGADWNGVNGNVTTVGSAGSTTFYGTFDQAGNLFEWNETLISPGFRGLRGGSWFASRQNLDIFNRNLRSPIVEDDDAGFRLASSLQPCPEIDLASPFGTLDAADVVEFVTRVDSDDPAGDFNDDGDTDFFDVVAYLAAFDAGCPQEIVLRDSIGPDATWTENQPIATNWSRPGPGNQFYPVFELSGGPDGVLLTRVQIVGRAEFGFAFDWTYGEFELRIWSSQAAVEMNREDGELLDIPVVVAEPPSLLGGSVSDNRLATFLLPSGGFDISPLQTVYFSIVQSNPLFPDLLVTPESAEVGPSDFYLNGAGIQPASGIPFLSSGRFGVRFYGIPGQ